MMTLAEKLIVAGKILVAEGHDDFVLGHVSGRDPKEPNKLLLKAATIGVDEITPENLNTINLEDMSVEGPLPRHLESIIHTQIMLRRPEINAVVHTHPPYAIAFSALEKPLLAISHDAAIFFECLPVFGETTDLIQTVEQAEAMTKALGSAKALVLKNHGIVTCGESVEEAVYLAIYLERACKIQLIAEAAGPIRATSTDEEARSKRARQTDPALMHNTFQYLIRKCQ